MENEFWLFTFFFISLLYLTSSDCFSQEQKYYFYTGKEYGSEYEYNPISLILNGSFDIIQLENFSRKPADLYIRQGVRNVNQNIFSPFRNIKVYGWKHFLQDEVLPFNFNKNHAQWWPNYQLHLIGGGMTFVATEEWYRLHDVPQPWLASVATIAAYHYLNEVIENGNMSGTNVDPISDIWIFDVGGCLLFTSDHVKSFFSSTLNLRDWSQQPSYSLNTGEIHNNGQYFSVKWYPVEKIPLGVFYYCGMNGVTGVSYKVDSTETLSMGCGLRAKQQYAASNGGNEKTVKTVWTAGLFWDRSGSLMSSLFFSGLSDYLYNLNIYPGVIRFGILHPGFWVAGDKRGKLAFGLNILGLPGISYSSLNQQ